MTKPVGATLTFPLRITKLLSAIFFYRANLIIALLISLSFSSCKDPDDIGLEVQPVNDKFHPGFNNTEEVVSYSLLEDPLRTDETVYNLLGSYVDPIFGKTTCSFFTQVILSADAPDFTGAVLDSSVLALTYNTSYSDPSQINALQHLKVYELNSVKVKSDSSFSNTDMSGSYNAATPIADLFFSPQPTTGVFVGTEVLEPQLRINFPASFGQHFLDAQNAPALANNSDFLNFFKGFYLTVDNPSQTTGQGAILSFNMLKATSKYTIYYKVNNVPEHFDFVIDNTCGRGNIFSHNYTASTAINAQLNDKELGKTLTYIQPLAGLKTKLEMPFLKNWMDSMPVVINKAELVFKVDEPSVGAFAPSNKLFLVGVNSQGKNLFISDQFEGDAYFGGVYNSATKEYRFNIARHVQQILSGEKTDYGLYLLCAGASVIANRTVIKGGKNIVLNISYTKL